jgi:PEGA domain
VATEVARAKALAPASPAPKDLETQWSDTFVADERRPQRSFEPVPSHKRTWLIAASVAIVAVVGSLFAFGVIPIGKSSSKASASVVTKEPETGPTADAPWVDGTKSSAAAGPGGELQVESTPPGARVLLDGKESGFTPLTLKDVPAGRHALVLEGESGTVRRTVRIQTGERTVARYEITAGFLSVFSRIPVEIYQGSRKIGVSGDKSILLAPGQYKVSLVNSHFRYNAEADFTIRPGEVTTHTVELPTGLLAVNTSPGAEILVEGERVGVAPIAPISIPIGTREIIVRHPQLGERRQSVEVLAGNKPVELSVIFEGNAGQRTPPKLAPLSMPPPATRSH